MTKKWKSNNYRIVANCRQIRIKSAVERISTMSHAMHQDESPVKSHQSHPRHANVLLRFVDGRFGADNEERD